MEGESRLAQQNDLLMFTELERRAADEDTAVDVDVIILDYVTHMALVGCRSCTGRDRATGIEQTITADAFLQMFRARHGDSVQLDPILHFRLQLLQLVTLLTFRYGFNVFTPQASSIKKLRQENVVRARQWIRHPDRLPSKELTPTAFQCFPLPDATLSKNREKVLQSLEIPNDTSSSPRNVFYGTTECVSLLDLLPYFMQASAAHVKLFNARIERQWMHLAGEFMLQACIEQYLSFGADGLDAIDEAFAWGYTSTSTAELPEMENTDDSLVNAMFEDATDKTEVNVWGDIKQAFLDKMYLAQMSSSDSSAAIPSSSDPANLTIEAAAAEHPLPLFEKNLCGFLWAMADSFSLPVLCQLEHGHLDGMSKAETLAFLKDVCGWSNRELREFNQSR